MKKEGARGKDDFGKVGVLVGGPSSEREISLKSGAAVYDALRTSGVAVEAIDITTDGRKENEDLLLSRGIDCAFISLHGRFGEDGRIQEILEGLNIPYTGSGVEASRLSMDKVASRQMFRKRGLDVPGCVVLTDRRGPVSGPPLPGFLSESGFPVVVKPAANGSSIGLSIADNREQLAQSIAEAFSYDARVVVEEYIAGRELTVGIVGDTALPIIEIIPRKVFFDYEAKYKSGMTDYLVPAPLDADVARLVSEAARAAHSCLGCYGCSRVDIILSAENIPNILEVNTIPGMTQTSLLPKAAAAAGMDFTELCKRLITYAYEKAGVLPAG